MVTAESPASRDSPITLSRKQTGKPIAGNRHDGFEVAGAGTQLTVRLLRHSQRKRGATARRNLRSMALALDPTNHNFRVKRRLAIVRSIPVAAPDSFEKLSESNGGFIADTCSNRTLRA